MPADHVKKALLEHVLIDTQALKRKYMFQREALFALDEVDELLRFWSNTIDSIERKSR